MGASDLPEHVQANRHYWDGMADQWVAAGERLWASEPQWGQWGVSNAEAPLPARQPIWTGRDRTRLRHGLRLGVV